MRSERREVVEVLEGFGRPVSALDVSSVLGKSHDAARVLLNRMANDGQLQRVGSGRFAALTWSSQPDEGQTVTDGQQSVTETVTSDDGVTDKPELPPSQTGIYKNIGGRVYSYEQDRKRKGYT